VDDVRNLWPSRLEFVDRFLTLENLDFIRNRFPQLGVLSIDVDGNDYWFLKALIDTSPTVISVEYNSTLGFEPVTVSYDESFDNQKHPLGWYHGASLTALTNFAQSTATVLLRVRMEAATLFSRGTENSSPRMSGSQRQCGRSAREFLTNGNGMRSSICHSWLFDFDRRDLQSR
jgi:hypothetical protein